MMKVTEKIGRRLTRLGSVAIVGVGLIPCAAGSAAAEDHTLDLTYSWQMTVKQAYSMEGGRTFLLAELNALLLPDRDTAGPLATPRVMTCPGTYDLGRDTVGYCFQTDADGDQIYLAIHSTPAPREVWAPGATGASAGEWSFTGGTGKFAGLTGQGTYIAHTIRSLPGGVIWGFSESNGTYSLPE